MNKVEKGNIGQSGTVLKVLITIEYEHQQDRQRQGSGKAWREQEIGNMR
jgi:hypothetical protein